MSRSFRFVAAEVLLAAVGFAAPAEAQTPDAARRAGQVDAVVVRAYQAAAAGFPCKPKSRGKPRMLRWEDVDRCLNRAASLVDKDALASELQELRKQARGAASEFDAAVDAALSAHALPYERVLSVKDARVLLPLTNSLLKYLPADSLHGLPVFDRVGTKVGTFLGAYSYERAGGLSSANPYRLTLFQYTDPNGNPQSAADKLLLDSFGVPWQDAAAQRGFRIPPEALGLTIHP